MRRLHVLRHAKSAWDDHGLPDHERPLAPRGQRDLPRLAAWLDEHGVRPRLIACSTAVRARQTLEGVRPSLGEPEVLLEPSLYLASPGALLDRVRSLPDVTEAMLVGHNPGLQLLAALLASASPERDRIAAKLPTGALVTLELDVERWADVDAGVARVTALVLPRELA